MVKLSEKPTPDNKKTTQFKICTLKMSRAIGRNQANGGEVINQHNALYALLKMKGGLSHPTSSQIFCPLSFLLRGIIR